MIQRFLLASTLVLCFACGKKQATKKETSNATVATPILEKGTFGYDVAHLKKYQKTIVLEKGNSKVAVVPAYQGRVMTSTSGGDKGISYGWLNYDLIASDSLQKQINVFGGEDRFWIGPEGGQYSIFFPKGAEFTIPNWQTPKEIDTETFDVVSENSNTATFSKEMHLENYSGTKFDIQVKRTVEALDKKDAEAAMSTSLDSDISVAAYQTINSIQNIGTENWSKEKGLLSIWILGMYNPSEKATVIVPYKGDLQLNDAYFGKVPADRLSTTEKAVFFKADGKMRGKIGVPFANALPLVASFDADNNVLTIVKYTINGNEDYVNSMWELQKKPYGGDVVNSYNDGPMENGTILGPFYELESSSSAKELKINETLEHTHSTFHFKGSKASLNKLSLSVLGVDLNSINI